MITETYCQFHSLAQTKKTMGSMARINESIESDPIDPASTTTASGSIKLLPQASAGGTPASVTSAMQDNLLDLSESVSDTVNVHSGIRTQTQQNSLSGKTANTVASTSQHTVGDAADISVTGMSGSGLAKSAVNSGSFERVNLYPSGAVHVDQRNVGPGTQYYDNWNRKPSP